MKQKEIIRKIGVIINELQEQYEFIEQTKQEINDLELELFVANTQFLVEHIEILRKLNQQTNQNTKAEPAVKINERYFEPLVQPAALPIAAPSREIVKSESDGSIYQDLTLRQQIKPADKNENELANTGKTDEPLPEHNLQNQQPAIAEGERQDLFLQPDIWKTVEPSPITAKVYQPEVSQPTRAYPTEREEPGAWQIPVPKPIEPEAAETYFPRYKPGFMEKLGPLQEETPELIKQSNPDTKIQQTIESPQAALFKPAEPEPVNPAEEKPAGVYLSPVSKPEPEELHPLLTINQKISAQMNNSSRLAEQMEVKPIKDLKTAINFNDKMLFVRDLFNGYSLSYGEAIEILNRFSKFAEADQFLKTNYVIKNNWEAKQDTANMFYSLLKRRFPL